MSKHCWNCRYAKVKSYNEPCYSCKSLAGWQPKQEASQKPDFKPYNAPSVLRIVDGELVTTNGMSLHDYLAAWQEVGIANDTPVCVVTQRHLENLLFTRQLNTCA
jgi:hypothetical protein